MYSFRKLISHSAAYEVDNARRQQRWMQEVGDGRGLYAGGSNDRGELARRWFIGQDLTLSV